LHDIEGVEAHVIILPECLPPRSAGATVGSSNVPFQREANWDLDDRLTART
jgi:hypothetical protein